MGNRERWLVVVGGVGGNCEVSPDSARGTHMYAGRNGPALDNRFFGSLILPRRRRLKVEGLKRSMPVFRCVGGTFAEKPPPLLLLATGIRTHVNMCVWV